MNFFILRINLSSSFCEYRNTIFSFISDMRFVLVDAGSRQRSMLHDSISAARRGAARRLSAFRVPWSVFFKRGRALDRISHYFNSYGNHAAQPRYAGSPKTFGTMRGTMPVGGACGCAVVGDGDVHRGSCGGYRCDR